MILKKPKFWHKKDSPISIILFPLTWIVLLTIFLKKKIIKPVKFNIPIICVGNVYIGGTGKTPVCIFLAKKLSEMGIKTAIMKKYYKSHLDEHKLIKDNFNNLILDNDRAKGIKKAEKNNYDTVILDDGFQDYKINKNLNIICFNDNQLIGNGLVIPSGPLRENLQSLNTAHIVLINGEKNIEFEEKILNINKNLKVYYFKYLPQNINQLEKKELLAVAAIGNPENFFKLIRENNLNIKKELIYPDHYNFSKTEIENILKDARNNNYHIVMTEKDYAKFKSYDTENLTCLKVSLKIDNEESFIKTIKKLYDKKN